MSARPAPSRYGRVYTYFCDRCRLEFEVTSDERLTGWQRCPDCADLIETERAVRTEWLG